MYGRDLWYWMIGGTDIDKPFARESMVRKSLAKRDPEGVALINSEFFAFYADMAVAWRPRWRTRGQQLANLGRRSDFSFKLEN